MIPWGRVMWKDFVRRGWVTLEDTIGERLIWGEDIRYKRREWSNPGEQIYLLGDAVDDGSLIQLTSNFPFTSLHDPYAVLSSTPLSHFHRHI